MMTVEQRKPLTLEEVVQELREFEEKYSMSTAEFQAKLGLDFRVEDDDAMDWLYRAKQLLVLRGEDK